MGLRLGRMLRSGRAEAAASAAAELLCARGRAQREACPARSVLPLSRLSVRLSNRLLPMVRLCLRLGILTLHCFLHREPLHVSILLSLLRPVGFGCCGVRGGTLVLPVAAVRILALCMLALGSFGLMLLPGGLLSLLLRAEVGGGELRMILALPLPLPLLVLELVLHLLLPLLLRHRRLVCLLFLLLLLLLLLLLQLLASQCSFMLFLGLLSLRGRLHFCSSHLRCGLVAEQGCEARRRSDSRMVRAALGLQLLLRAQVLVREALRLLDGLLSLRAERLRLRLHRGKSLRGRQRLLLLLLLLSRCGLFPGLLLREPLGRGSIDLHRLRRLSRLLRWLRAGLEHRVTVAVLHAPTHRLLLKRGAKHLGGGRLQRARGGSHSSSGGLCLLLNPSRWRSRPRLDLRRRRQRLRLVRNQARLDEQRRVTGTVHALIRLVSLGDTEQRHTTAPQRVRSQ